MSFLSVHFRRLTFAGLVEGAEEGLVLALVEVDVGHHYWLIRSDCLERRNAAETMKAD